MTLLRPQTGITYGPVRSRRLGRSLGINLLPPGRKTCTFDCLYCQYGFAAPCPSALADATDFPSVKEVVAAVEAALDALDEPPAYLTFSGNGEPTLHPRFGEIVDRIIALRDRKAPPARTAVLSNSSLVDRPPVRAALRRLDCRIMKLDVGTVGGLRHFNQPASGITLEAIVEGLKTLPDVTIQSLFAGGGSGNLDPPEIAAWVDRLISIRPRAVQIYSLDRAPACDRLEPASRADLQTIEDRLRAVGLAADAH